MKTRAPLATRLSMEADPTPRRDRRDTASAWSRMSGMLSLIVALWRTNLSTVLEYRANFFMQSVGMFVNDLVVVVFWAYIYSRFPVAPGYSPDEYILLFGMGALTIGLPRFFVGNAERMSDWIADGGLDTFLVWPKPVALHFSCSRLNFHAVGDIVFGVMVFFLVRGWDVGGFVLFLVLGALGGIVYHGFEVAVNSLAFWLGHVRHITLQAIGGLIIFSTYPFSVFEGFVRILLFTLIPAAYLAGVPVEILAEFTWRGMGIMLAGAIGALAVGYGLFYWGLRRYESGSRITVNV